MVVDINERDPTSKTEAVDPEKVAETEALSKNMSPRSGHNGEIGVWSFFFSLGQLFPFLTFGLYQKE